MQYTFLELVQMTARASGTVPSDLPQTVTGQTGRLGKIVRWVQTAWEDIQRSKAFWRWMHSEFSGETSPGLGSYASTQFGLTRFSRWINLPDTISIYKKDIGKSDEQFIYPIEYWRYRRLYDIGVQENARPSCFSISPANTLCIGPIPDSEYEIRGEYYKSPQDLVNDNDVPEVPQQHRAIIAWKALLLLSEYDEAPVAMNAALRRYREALGDLERDQLPQLQMITGTILRQGFN